MNARKILPVSAVCGRLTMTSVEYMCKAFEEVRNEGYARGMQQGMQQGAERKEITNIKTLMETMNWIPFRR